MILGLLILVFHLTRPWTFWKLMFHYSFTSVMSMGVMLFQLYKAHSFFHICHHSVIFPVETNVTEMVFYS